VTFNIDNKIRLFITVEQRLYRDAVLFDLVNQKDIDIVGESSTGVETLSLLDMSAPSTLIIEENLKDMDGLTIAEAALLKIPSLVVILLVDDAISQNRLAIYLDSGIKSVISKKQSLQDLNKSLNYTRNGHVYIDGDRYRNETGRLKSQVWKVESFSTELFQLLSEREQEVAKYIADHIPLKRIAEELGVSHKTVHTYKERILIKLGFERLPELVVYMKRLHFYRLQEGVCQ